MSRKHSVSKVIVLMAAAAAASCVSSSGIREAEAKKIGFQQCKADWVRGPYHPESIDPGKWKARPDGDKWVVYAGTSRKLCQFMVNVSAEGQPAQCMKCIGSGD
jgi:hypothetical protein